jgi:hypothetical protein
MSRSPLCFTPAEKNAVMELIYGSRLLKGSELGRKAVAENY